MRDTTIAEVELEKRNQWLAELKNLKLNSPLSIILRKMKSLGILRPPKPIRMPPEKRDREKFREFYKDHGHVTHECLTLKGQIAIILKKDKLLEFLEKNANHMREETRPNPSGSGEKVCIINAIYGRIDQQNSSGYRLNSRKRLWEDLKEVCILQREQIRRKKIAQISFGEEDPARVQTPHDDPLVVTLRIRECDVQRILIDGGSSANVIFLESFKKLWLDESQIQRSSSLLIGFGGTKVTPVGMILLSVEAVGRSLEVEFVVINAQSTYNAIMGKWMDS